MSTKEHKRIELTPKEAVDMIKHIITNNRVLESEGKKKVTLALEGESGIGKTSIIEQTAKELGLGVIKRNFAQFEELGDLTGFPQKEYKMCKEAIEPITEVVKVKKIVDEFVIEERPIKKQVIDPVTKQASIVEVQGKVRVPKKVEKEVEELVVVKEGNDFLCEWVNEKAIEHYKYLGYKMTNESRMGYAIPEFVVDKGEGYILLLDDFSRAEQRFIQATMELVDKQEYASWSLPKDWHIILTNNPDNSDYFVTSLDDAQRTRFITFNLKFNIEDWAN